MTRFALIGAAGFVAPRHMKAMKETGSTLMAALDRADNVGVMDSYFPDAHFFVEFERFDRHLDKLRRAGNGVDYLTVCSPNYLHDSHVRFGLRSGANVICEKPLVLNPWNIDAISEIEAATGHRVSCILQLRVHPAIVELRSAIQARIAAGEGPFDVDLTYITSRGRWYQSSWKGDPQKSGGLATNIGIHFFDMLLWIFGPMNESRVHRSDAMTASGVLALQHARVRWFLSIDSGTLPPGANGRTFRSITVGGKEIEFSEGFTDLHTVSYREILAGRGFPAEETRPSIEIAHAIRTARTVPPDEEAHPFCSRASS
jgi:UDP-N-acetyl-2-amino-2-deoxyglucuronate dehydrogenase